MEPKAAEVASMNETLYSHPSGAGVWLDTSKAPAKVAYAYVRSSDPKVDKLVQQARREAARRFWEATNWRPIAA